MSQLLSELCPYERAGPANSTACRVTVAETNKRGLCRHAPRDHGDLSRSTKIRTRSAPITTHVKSATNLL
jgi:hypothetical protein